MYNQVSDTYIKTASGWVKPITSTDFYCGDGSEEYPFIIKDIPNGDTAVTQYYRINDPKYIDKGYYFQLQQNLIIDRIEESPTGFIGTFDGNGYKIRYISALTQHPSDVIFISGKDGEYSCVKRLIINPIDITVEVRSRCIIHASYISECYFVYNYIYKPDFTIVSLTENGTITDCKFEHIITDGSLISADNLHVTVQRILMTNTFKKYLLQVKESEENTIRSCAQMADDIEGDNPSLNKATRFIYGDKTELSKITFADLYACENCMVEGNIPTDGITSTEYNGESVPKSICLNNKGFWDGTGVEGKTYLDWDLDNIWSFTVGSYPNLRMIETHDQFNAPSMYVKTDNGWKLNNELDIKV